MKKNLLSLLLLMNLSACKEETKVAPPQSLKSFEVSSEDFSEFKPKDESCDSEEELKKKLEEDLKKNESAPTLGGITDGGCEVK